MAAVLNGSHWFKRRIGFTFNEGGAPFNMMVLWGGFMRGFYVYCFGIRIHSFWKPR